MSEQIKKSDISEKDIYGYIIESAKLAEKQVKELNDELIKSAKLNKDALKNNKVSNSSELKEAEKAIKLANIQKKEALKLDNDLIKIQAQKLRADEQLRKATEATTKAVNKENNAYTKLSKSARDLKNESKRLGAELLHLEQSGKRNTKEFALIERQYRQTTGQAVILDRQLKKLDSSVGDNQRNVGNYGSAITKLRGGLAQLGLAFGVFQIARNSFNTIVEFEQGVANLASVLGTTGDKIKSLTEDAKRLGASTIFTASEVASLQTEFAKLGFTEAEILKVTEGTLMLASATGTDLARSAEVAGATLRGFGLDASETNRVTDVMAMSFSKSALDMEKFAEAMKYVAPVAKVAGISIEETTAMLSTLANAGISGSQAGTAMRQIVSEMDKTGKSTSEALADLAKKGLNLADAEDEVGKNAKTALLVLADQTKQTAELSKQYTSAEGSAKAMADTQENTLGGSIKLLTSAWDGFVLSMNEAGGVGSNLSGTIKFLANNLTTILSVIGKAILAFTTFKTVMLALKLKDQFVNWKNLRGAIADSTTATNEASSSAKGFGNALKGIGFTVLIGLATELAMEFYDIASGTRKAREEFEKYQRGLSQGEKFGQESVQRIKDGFEASKRDLDLRKAQGKLTEKQYKDELNALNQLTDAKIRGEIQLANENKARFEGNKSVQAKENATLKELYKLLNDRKNISIDNKIADLESAKATDENTKSVKTHKKAVDDLNKTYQDYLSTRKELTRDEYTPPELEFADIENANDLINRRRKAIIDIELLQAEKTKNDDKIRKARIKAIKDNLELELENFDLLESEKEKLRLQAEKDIADIEREQFVERLKTTKEFIDLSADYFIKRSEDKIAQLDKEIDASQKQFDNLQELANQGNITAQQSLAEQQRIINEANSKKIAEQKRIERIKLAETAFGVYSSKLEAGDKNPLLSTIKDVTLLNQFISSLPAFEDGTENTGSNGRGVDGKGGFHAVLHPNERVMTKEQNALVGDLSNTELSRIASDYNNGKIVNLSNSAMAGNSFDLVPLLSEIKSLKRTIEDRPTHNIAMGEITQSIMQIVEKTTKGNRVERKIYNIRK